MVIGGRRGEEGEKWEENKPERNSEKSGNKYILGAYMSNKMGGQKCSSMILHLPFPSSILSIDFPKF